jgi:hypothetical protein
MKPKFTGHDTFPLRYGWLFKAVNFIKNKGLLSSSDAGRATAAVSALGVGKNMINAMKYWSEAATLTNSIAEPSGLSQGVTPLGVLIFDEEGGKDPFLDNIGSIWILHFLLNFDDEGLTAYRYFFNYSNALYFEKVKLLEDLCIDAAQLTGQKKLNVATVKKDVDCFLNTYAVKPVVQGGKKVARVNEDTFQSPLSELGLIVDVGRGLYRSEPSGRITLPLAVFLYALVRFHLDFHGDADVLQTSFEDILTRPKSPGRIFRLSESALGQLLDQAVARYPRQVQWIDSLGLKQVVLEEEILRDPTELIITYYESAGR